MKRQLYHTNYGGGGQTKIPAVGQEENIREMKCIHWGKDGSAGRIFVADNALLPQNVLT